MRSRRRWVVPWIALILLFAGCGSDPTPPHVFVFVVDTLRADHTGVYGYERATTPRLDAFAEDAFVMTDAYSASPWTRPSVTSLFTGLPPQIHGVRGRDGWLVDGATTWAEAMRDRGVHTAAWFTNANLESHYGLGQGFDDYEFEETPGKPYVDGLTMVARWGAALDAQPADRAWMHYVHLMDPHLPYQPQRPYRIPFVNQNVPWRRWFDGDAREGAQIQRDVNNYDAEILQADAAFGRFLDILVERGLYEDSWIVFTSDHGEEFLEHGSRGHGNGLWENQLRVPLVIRPPKGRTGPFAGRLQVLVNEPLPLHALADLIGGAIWPDWEGLGRENLGRLGLAASVPEAWIPTPDQLAPRLRRASFTLDGRAAMMVARDHDKLQWQELPRAGWRASDLQRDPHERQASPRRSGDLIEELQAYALAGWRGLRLTATGPDTLTIELRFDPIDALREVRVPVGDAPAGLGLRREVGRREVRWTAAPGQSLVVRGRDDARLQWRTDGGDWSELDVEAQVELGLMVTPTGPAEDPSASAPGPIDPELERKLRALGYLQ